MVVKEKKSEFYTIRDVVRMMQVSIYREIMLDVFL